MKGGYQQATKIETTMLDKDNPSFWRDILPGSTVTINDEQAIADSIERGEGVSGRDYLVESIWKIRQEEGLAEWLLFKLDDDEQEVFLVAKIVDRSIDLYVFFEPDEFEPGNRRDIVDREDLWVFEEPKDFEDFSFDELEFVHEFRWIVDAGDEDDSGEKEIEFRLKAQGILYGSCTRDPVQSGIDRMMASVAEFSTTDDYENPEVMIIELGGEKSDEGGLISLMVGCPIRTAEVEVLKTQVEKPVVRRKPSLWEKVLKRVGK